MKSIYLPLVYSVQRLKKDFIGALITGIWVPFFLLFLNKELLVLNNYWLICINLLTFFILYEVGYLISDNLGYLFENKLTRTKYAVGLYAWPKVFVGIGIRLVLVWGLLHFFANSFLPVISGYYALTLVVFVIHSFLKEQYRPATLIVLRSLKILIPYAFLIFDTQFTAKLVLFVGILGGAIYNAIPYTIKKLRGATKIDVTSLLNSSLKLFIILGLIIPIGILFPLDYQVATIFVVIIILHHLLFVGLRFLSNKK